MTRSLRFLSLAHICLLTISNVLVQYPFYLFGFHTTWGAFSYPLIFITTDLTTRLFGAAMARQVVFRSMLPGLISSYCLACVFNQDSSRLFMLPELPLRIAGACFCAYVIGQLLDILVFQRVNNNRSWWLAPTLATSISNVIDTLVFFSLAFYHCGNPFLSQHWMEIALVDLGFKTLISFIAFVPLYGVILRSISSKRTSLIR